MVILCIMAGKFLVYTDPQEKSDVIAVLAGNDDSRIYEAASLYHQGIASNIILTKTNQTFGEYDLPYTMLQEEMLQNLNIPNGAIYIAEISSKNTGQEASAVKRRMYDLGYSSVTVVTDAWHSRRTKMIFSDSFKNAGFKVYIHPVPDSGYSKYFWWLSSEGWQKTISEYIRIIGYIIKRESNIPDYPNF